MNKATILLFYCLIALVYSSCQIYGITTGINLLSQQDKQRVVYSNVSIDSLYSDGNVHIVSIDRIKEYTQKDDTIVVYTWVPGCSSDQCVLPSAIEDYCQQRHFKCLILLVSFTSTNCFSLYDAKETPLIMPDFSIYNTKYKSKYYPLFNKEMVGNERDYDIWIFAGGRYLKSVRLEELAEI